ncbi:AbiU2 domain-containing protein [Nitrospira sp. T9]|uniref:AbiU2 domain-containing protein n=1 Tax=unclassified Nitrospira TaxID=2652172 RepID=UPI003F966468
MESFIDTPLDKKRIGLVKILHSLRQNLDLYCLISVNVEEINQVAGKSFWGHLQRLAIQMISLELCKIYEKERNFELNSIDSVVLQLTKDNALQLDYWKLKSFIQTYKSPLKDGPSISTLQATIDLFLEAFQKDFERFKFVRDKIIAHSEYDVDVSSLPSYDTMERLFIFGADFYDLVSSAFGDVSPVPIKDDRRVKTSLIKVLNQLGVERLKEDME